MTDRKLLRTPQRKLALSYGVMIGLVYLFIGADTYYFTSQHHHETIDQEISFIANTIHNNLEPKLIAPDRIDPTITEVFPDFCIAPTCTTANKPQRHFTSAFASTDRYYLILVSNQGQIKATAGREVQPPTLNSSPHSTWSTWQDSTGKRYRQYTFVAHSYNSQQPYSNWGTAHIGRDISDVDNSLQSLKTGLILSFPLALAIIGSLSWYLAGRAMLPLYQAYEQQQLFATSVAHELRTPLAINQLKIEQQITRWGQENSQLETALSGLRDRNMQLTGIVSDLLLLAQLDRPTLADNHTVCDLAEVVIDITEEISALHRHHHIITTIPAQIQPVKIRGSPDRITRLVSNLVDNAVKYTPPGGQIQISITAAPRHYLLKVQDTGSGIAPTELYQIFDRFYRTDRDRDRRSGGIGLGLTLVKSIAQLYGAQVKVSSQVGRGSTFTVVFPRPWRGHILP
jgi:signal transduction histidine kinase